MSQGIQNVIFCEASGGVSSRMHLLELINDHGLVHLLHLLFLHDVSDVIDYTRRLIVVAEAVILLISSLGLLLFLVHLLQRLEAEVH